MNFFLKLKQNKMYINSIIYIVSNLLLKAFNFLLLPLYTSYLSTTQYGIINIATRFQNVATYVVSCCLSSAVIRFYIKNKQDEEKTKRIFGTIITFIFCTGMIFVFACIMLNKVLTRYVFAGIEFWPTSFMAISTIMYIAMVAIYQEMMKAKEKAFSVAILSLSFFFIQLSSNIICVVIFELGSNGVIFSSGITNFLLSMIMLIYLLIKKEIKLGIDSVLLKELLIYSLPLLPHNLSSSISALCSSTFINKFGSLANVGIYSLAMQFGSVAENVQASLNAAYQPWFFSALQNNFEYKQIKKRSNTMIWISCWFFLCLALFSVYVIKFVCAEQYWSASDLVPLVIAVYLANIPYLFYVNILFFYEKGTNYIFYATLPASILNIILTYFLVQEIGVKGSIISDLVFVCIKFIIIYVLAQKFNKRCYKVSQFTTPIVITVLILVGCNYLQGCVGEMMMVIYKIIIVLFYPFGLLIAWYFEKKKRCNNCV